MYVNVACLCRYLLSKKNGRKDSRTTTMIIIRTNFLFLIINYVSSSNLITSDSENLYSTKTVTWEPIGRKLYYAELTGKKAHSWWDAYNRCSRLRPGNPYPAVFPNDDGIAEYLSKRHAELNIDQGDVVQGSLVAMLK